FAVDCSLTRRFESHDIPNGNLLADWSSNHLLITTALSDVRGPLLATYPTTNSRIIASGTTLTSTPPY
ncbi:hypothetical protein M407DRAFT_212156, partial [Tulasnella calospora MUT 4182]